MEFRESLLLDILRQPTAPFREHHVLTRISSELDRAGVPYFADPVGNLVLGVSSRAAYRRLLATRSREPLRLFIAHTDHPGFHGVRWKSELELEIKWHGGSPTRHLEGANVWLASREGALGPHHAAVTAGIRLVESGRAIDGGEVRLYDETRAQAQSLRLKPREIYGGFSFRAPAWHEGDLLYTKAADDLIGAFSIVSLALDYFSGGKPRDKKTRRRAAPPFIGLLTRAEEVGFVGAIGHLELGWLKGAKRPVLAVSLETSRQLPGAEIGKGPVVRLGDRYTVFDPGGLRILTEMATRRLPGGHQRRVMDGGTCEGTAATVYGIPSIGISVPLGNYHNQSFEGGPDAAAENGPAPEFVSLSDARGLLELCHGLLEPGLPWHEPWKAKRAELRKCLESSRKLLAAGP